MKPMYVCLLSMVFAYNLRAQIPPYIPTNGLAAYYPFDGNANDISGNNNHAVVNGPSLTSDRFSNSNSAYLFDGFSNYMSVNLTSTLTTNWTVSGWYKIEPDNSFNSYYAFGLGYSPNANGFGFGGTGHSCYPMKYGMYDGGNGSGCSASESLHGSTTPDYSQWMHVVLVKSGSNYSYYLNGVNDGSKTLGTMTIGNFVIGKRADNILFYNGKMDEIGIWNRVLTPNEIATIHSGLVSVSEITKNETVIVYPNPSNKEVSLNVNKAYLNTDYILTDVLGQTLLKQTIANEDLTINLEEFASGIYFLNIQGIAPIKIIKE